MRCAFCMGILYDAFQASHRLGNASINSVTQIALALWTEYYELSIISRELSLKNVFAL